MVLSADDMNIRKELMPFFCAKCGIRLGWGEDNGFIDDFIGYCQDCSKND